MKNRGFTLIEILVVTSIIGVLSSVVTSTLSTVRTKALDASAFSEGINVTTSIAACHFDGGKVTLPNSLTNPTNNLCTLGANYGGWPKPPQGWVWHDTVWTNDQENLMGLAPTYSGSYGFIHCGYYAPFSGFCGSPHVGLCRLSRDFSCTAIEIATGIWK